MRLDFSSSRRGYTLELSEDLFGAYILRRRWFGLSNKRGGVKQQVFLTEEDAMREIRRVMRARIRNGYRLQ